MLIFIALVLVIAMSIHINDSDIWYIIIFKPDIPLYTSSGAFIANLTVFQNPRTATTNRFLGWPIFDASIIIEFSQVSIFAKSPAPTRTR
jgi:hypothetical protein